jgi:hypothetical protein
MKEMFTGPVTIFDWSFVRNDVPRSLVATQIALALSDEVGDLQKAGIKIIQVGEAALRFLNRSIDFIIYTSKRLIPTGPQRVFPAGALFSFVKKQRP